jgi:hypothetical protein
MKKKNLAVFRLEEIYGRDALEIEIHPHGLLVPGWRNVIPWAEIRATFWRCQERTMLESRVAQLRRDLERAQAERDELERRCAYYRRLVSLEATLGMMFARIAG